MLLKKNYIKIFIIIIIINGNVYAYGFFQDNSYFIFRNNYNNISDNILQLTNFTELEKNNTEIGFVARNNIFINNSLQVKSQVRLFNEGIISDKYNYDNNVKLYIDEIYLNLATDNFYSSIGRKKINTQISYFFPVLDIFSRVKRQDISFFDKSIETSGQDIVDVESYFGNFHFHIVYAYDFKDNDKDLIIEEDRNNQVSNIDSSKILLKTTAFIDKTNTDILFLYLYDEYQEVDIFSNKKSNTFGFSINQTFGDNTIIFTENKISNKKDFENIYHKINKKWINEYNIGINYTFKNNINLLIEYYYNGNGYLEEEWHLLSKDIQNSNLDVLSSFYGYIYTDKEYLKRNYLAWRLGMISNSRFNLNVGQIISLDDNSFQLMIDSQYDLNDKSSLYLQVNSFIGEDLSEYDVIPYQHNILLFIKYFI